MLGKELVEHLLRRFDGVCHAQSVAERPEKFNGASTREYHTTQKLGLVHFENDGPCVLPSDVGTQAMKTCIKCHRSEADEKLGWCRGCGARLIHVHLPSSEPRHVIITRRTEARLLVIKGKPTKKQQPHEDVNFRPGSKRK